MDSHGPSMHISFPTLPGDMFPEQHIGDELHSVPTGTDLHSPLTRDKLHSAYTGDLHPVSTGQQSSHFHSSATTLVRSYTKAGIDLNDEKVTKSDSESSEGSDLEKQSPKKGSHFVESSDVDPHLISWDGPNDPGNPMNWPRWKKWLATITMGLMTFTVTFASSVFSTATFPTAELFGVSPEVTTLGTALFVAGFVFGPLLFAPMSEVYGRKIPLMTGVFIFAIFNIPVAVAQNLETVLVCRFFAGFFASAPLSVCGGALNDFWNPVDRAVAMCIFSGAVFTGPAVGPIVGGFVTQSYLGWRWTAWLTLIMTMLFLGCGILFIPESFAPVLLSRRAKKIRFETRNWAIHAKADETPVDLEQIVQKYLTKPFQMLSMEPILILVTIYMALIYGIIYLTFEAFPISFQEQRHMNMGVGALPFLALPIGVIVGNLITVYLTKTRYARKLAEHGSVAPEERLISMMIGGVILPISLFWFGWTSSPHLSVWPEIISIGFIGMGVMMVFLSGFNYIVDCYKWEANSAIAGNTFVRSWLGAGFPLFASAMFHNLGIPWASSVLAFISLALLPTPILFFIYGARIRKLSKFVPTFG